MNPNDKINSLERLSKNMNCSTSRLKEVYKKSLMTNKFSAQDIQGLLSSLANKKVEEANIFGISIDDTAAAFMEEWTSEYLINKEYADRVRDKKEVFNDIFTEYPELKFISLDKQKYNLHLMQNEQLIHYIAESLAYCKIPSKKYIDFSYKETDLEKKLILLNRGLSCEDDGNRYRLLKMKAKCLFELRDFGEALITINLGIDKIMEELEKTDEISNEYVARFFTLRALIKEEMDDDKGAKIDWDTANVYFEKHYEEYPEERPDYYDLY